MASKAPVAVYDACVLYPFHLRNVLIQCAFDGLVDTRSGMDAQAGRQCAGHADLAV